MVIAVGSHSRNAGKTSLVCALISALPEARWTAVKISGHEHGAGEAYAFTEESDAAGPHDTSRYLRAGAARSYVLRSSPGRLAEAMPALRAVLEEAENSILESSRAVEFVQPDLFLFVLNESAPDFKETARAYLARADRVVVMGETEQTPPEIVELVRERLCTRKRNR